MTIENILENDIDNEQEVVENICNDMLLSQQWKAEIEYGNTYYAALEFMENRYEY